MSASAGFRIWGYSPDLLDERGMPYDYARPRVLTPPFAGERNAKEFAEELKKNGYIVEKIEWYVPPKK
jgi:hypothetical protein